jgi:hypothetical protein
VSGSGNSGPSEFQINGFSQNVWSPADKAISTWAACSSAGEHTATASRAHLSIILSGVAKAATGTPKAAVSSAAARADETWEDPHTAATSAPWP